MAASTIHEPPDSKSQPLFDMGQTVATPGALGACSMAYLMECLARHVCGDWGNICAEDKEANDQAVAEGDRILSAYPIDPDMPCPGYGGNCLWIITEWDRSVTTILLPDEY